MQQQTLLLWMMFSPTQKRKIITIHKVRSSAYTDGNRVTVIDNSSGSGPWRRSYINKKWTHSRWSCIANAHSSVQCLIYSRSSTRSTELEWLVLNKMGWGQTLFWFQPLKWYGSNTVYKRIVSHELNFPSVVALVKFSVALTGKLNTIKTFRARSSS